MTTTDTATYEDALEAIAAFYDVFCDDAPEDAEIFGAINVVALMFGKSAFDVEIDTKEFARQQ